MCQIIPLMAYNRKISVKKLVDKRVKDVCRYDKNRNFAVRMV